MNTSQPAIICSKLAIETLEQRVEYFTPCSSVSIMNFEQVNAGWYGFVILHYWKISW